MNEHLIDVLDIAAALTESQTSSSIANVRSAAKLEQAQREDGTWPVPFCVECDDEIPPERLKLGRVRCVACQTELELRRKQYASR